MKRKGDYDLNIDAGVALWLDSKDFHKKHPLHCALGFVILNSQVHDDFDKFKKAEALKDYSLLESLELLDLWCSSRKSSRVTVNKFSKLYIRLHSTEIDRLCRWGMELRESFDILDEAALQIHA